MVADLRGMRKISHSVMQLDAAVVQAACNLCNLHAKFLGPMGIVLSTMKVGSIANAHLIPLNPPPLRESHPLIIRLSRLYRETHGINRTTQVPPSVPKKGDWTKTSVDHGPSDRDILWRSSSVPLSHLLYKFALIPSQSALPAGQMLRQWNMRGGNTVTQTGCSALQLALPQQHCRLLPLG